MRVLAAVSALTLALSGCGRDGEPAAVEGPAEEPAAVEAPGPAAEPGAAEPAAPREGELLLASPPDGWEETGALRTATLRMAEYGPPGQSGGELERLTFEAQSGDPLPDPIDFVLGVARDLEQRCENFRDVNIASGFENGYPTSVRLMLCPEFDDSPYRQVVMAKAIRGNERFYVITRRLRHPAADEREQPMSAQAMAEWTTHLKSVTVCDTRSTDHPCPESVAGSPAAP